jgi:hypothetical protein
MKDALILKKNHKDDAYNRIICFGGLKGLKIR